MMQEALRNTLWIALTAAAILTSNGTSEDSLNGVILCDSIKINNHWYKKDILWNHVGHPINLNVHRASNTLFFAYSLSDSNVDIDFQLAYIKLDTDEYQNVAGIEGGCAIAIDQYDDVIYLGGSKGIYTFNMQTNIADKYKEGRNVWSLFFRNKLFCINFPNQKLHVEVDGKFVVVKEFDSFEVDNFYATGKHMLIANKSGLFNYNTKDMKMETINDVILVRQITVDNNDNLYVCSNLGVFILKGNRLKKVIALKNMYGLAFDDDNNIMYSSDKSIVRLVPSNTSCFDDHW